MTKDNLAEVEKLVAAFNAAEAQQAARLDQLYELLRARTGGARRVVFGNGPELWNCSFLNSFPITSNQYQIFRRDIDRTITIDPGSPPA